MKLHVRCSKPIYSENRIQKITDVRPQITTKSLENKYFPILITIQVSMQNRKHYNFSIKEKYIPPPNLT